MKLSIVQAVKLGTVACLLAVTTQTVGMGIENAEDPHQVQTKKTGIDVRTVGDHNCYLGTSTHVKSTETGYDNGKKYTYTTRSHCRTYDPAMGSDKLRINMCRAHDGELVCCADAPQCCQQGNCQD